MIVFFIAMGTFAVIRPDSGLQDWAGTISTAWIAVVSAASILLGHPFTLDFSRDGVGPEIAQSKLFLDINRTIAWVWTGAFAVMAASRSIAHALGALLAGHRPHGHRADRGDQVHQGVPRPCRRRCHRQLHPEHQPR